MSFSLWTTIPRFPKLLQTAGRKCLQPPSSFTSGLNSLSMTFLFFCKFLHYFLITNKQVLSYKIILQNSPLNVCFSLYQAQTDPSPVLPPAQEGPFGGQAILPWRDCSLPGSSGPADGVWRLHAWGGAPEANLTKCTNLRISHYMSWEGNLALHFNEVGWLTRERSSKRIV